jgi:hypothetical protein
MAFHEESAEKLLRHLSLPHDDRADVLDETLGRGLN